VVRSKDAIPFKNGRLFHDRTSSRRTVLHTNAG
jgi:hypothetical protein